MKITKTKLKQIIKEELEVVLTNEEVEEMFGEEVRAQVEAMDEDLDESVMYATATKIAKDKKWKSKVDLENIIKEEIEQAKIEKLNENPAAIMAAVAKYGPLIMQLINLLKDNPEIIDTIKQIAAARKKE